MERERKRKKAGRAWRLPTAVLVCGDGELVAAFVFRVPAMSLDVVEADFVNVLQAVQFLPKIGILDLDPFGTIFAAPSVLFPVSHPFLESFEHVLAIGIEADMARTAEHFQAFDHGPKLHAIIGGFSFRAPDPSRSFLDWTSRRTKAQPPGPGFPLQAPSV